MFGPLNAIKKGISGHRLEHYERKQKHVLNDLYRHQGRLRVPNMTFRRNLKTIITPNYLWD